MVAITGYWKRRYGAAVAVAVLLSPATVMAQPPVLAVAAGAVLSVTLDRDAGAVIVADPNIADVNPLGGKRLIIQGHAIGQTGLLVQDQSGATLIDSTIVVTPQRERTVSVTRGVEEDTLVCAPVCTSLGGARKNALGSGNPGTGAAAAQQPANAAPAGGATGAQAPGKPDQR